MRIVGLAGPIAVGKTTIAKKYYEMKGFITYSCSGTLRVMINEELFADIYPEVKKYADKGEDRHAFLELGMELRSKYGDDVVVDLTIKRAIMNNVDKVVIDGVRGKSEMKKIHEYGGAVVFLTAPEEVLFERFKNRGKKMDKNVKTLDDFRILLQKEEKDFGISDSMKYADVIVRNDGPLEWVLHVLESVGGC